MQLKGNLVDLHQRRILPAWIRIENGIIAEVAPLAGSCEHFILPGFIDAHIHIESSMLVPTEFARLAMPHGTVATVSDPHEIGNVLGLPGVEFMIDNARRTPLKIYFGAPSCVPATNYETAGATIGLVEIENLLARPDIRYLSEMMNYPGVIQRDPAVLAKIDAARRYGKPIDGHAPGIVGSDLDHYLANGHISTDHESFTTAEGREKLEKGLHLLIREGSAAKNFAALIPLLKEFPGQIQFCSDDKHPDDLIQGHINLLVSRAIREGHDLFDVLRAACLHPAEHYRLDVGSLRPGDPADFIVVDDLHDFKVRQTYIDGLLVAEDGRSLIDTPPVESINNFAAKATLPTDFAVPAQGKNMKVIQALDGEIVTGSFVCSTPVNNGFAVADPERDLLKFAIINRYRPAPPAIAFINGFGLQDGALASSVGHDSHNILVIGTSDQAISTAINLVIREGGGLSAVNENKQMVLPLPIAGLMTAVDGYDTAAAYSRIDRFVKAELGCSLTSPFMTLSFMALLVIPSLKLSDRGLFDGGSFQFTDLFAGS